MGTDSRAHQRPSVKDPLVIVGTGRCGSTLVHHVLASHEETAWLSRLCETRMPGPRANRLAMRIMDLPLPARYVQKLLYPVEAYGFWDHHCPAFAEPYRDLLAEDVTPKMRQAVRQAMSQMLTAKRNRLLVKVTGWPRIGFLQEIFPDARFIHVYRDGRAVANSLLAVEWWSGWRGPGRWRWGDLPPEQRAKWERHDRSFVALAAIQWEILMLAQKEAKERAAPESLFEVRYEDLCNDPVHSFRRMAEFAGLDWSARMEAIIRNRSFKNANDKWQTDLSSDQQSVLNECLQDTLGEFGYV